MTNSPENKSVLVIEHESVMFPLLNRLLGAAGFEVEGASDIYIGVGRAGELQPALIIINWTPSLGSVINACRILLVGGKTRNIRVIAISEFSSERFTARVLDAGADDHICIPFNEDVFMARVHAVLRRGSSRAEENLLRHNDIVMNLERHRVLRGGRDIHLNPLAFKLLKYLLENPGRTFTREQIREVVWGSEVSIKLRTVDVRVFEMRRCLGKPDLIFGVWGEGYGLGQ